MDEDATAYLRYIGKGQPTNPTSKAGALSPMERLAFIAGQVTAEERNIMDRGANTARTLGALGGIHDELQILRRQLEEVGR